MSQQLCAHRPSTAARHSQPAALPGSLHAIAACEAALAHRSGTETHRRQRSGRRRPHPGRRITLSALFRSAPCPDLGAMALQRAVYRPRDAEHTVLHQVIAEHLEVFLRTVAAAGDGVGLPQFVEREFREFLTCGVFEHGVTRFQCGGCAREHLVPFSCKGRAWCPSCGGRRMTERAAHLVDAVLPQVPVRQWVLTVPYRLRYQMAWNHGLSRAVLRVYSRVLLDVYARGARARGVPGGRTGSVTVMQRAGSGLNTNLHFHTLVLDGVFTEASGGALAFHPAPGPSDIEVAAALATIRHRVLRLLVRRGLEPSDDATGPADPLADESPIVAGIVGASVQGRVARARARVRGGGGYGGVAPHANVWVSANDRVGRNGCADTSCVHPSRRSACGCGVMAASRSS